MKNWTGLFHCTFPSSSGGGLTSMVTVGTVDASFRRFVADAVRLFGFKFLRNSNILNCEEVEQREKSMPEFHHDYYWVCSKRPKCAHAPSAQNECASESSEPWRGWTIKEYQCKLYELYRIHMGLVVHISTFDTFECIRCYFLGFIDFLAHLMYLDDWWRDCSRRVV